MPPNPAPTPQAVAGEIVSMMRSPMNTSWGLVIGKTRITIPGADTEDMCTIVEAVKHEIAYAIRADRERRQ